MGSGLKTIRLRIGGMTCVSCQNKIESKLQNTAGIKKVEVSYSVGEAKLIYDTDIISLQDISNIIEKLNYSVLTEDRKKENSTRHVIKILIIVVSLYALLQQFGILNLLVPSQLANTSMGYGMLFMIGLITSVHCVAMCGGINVSQCIPKREEVSIDKKRISVLKPSFLYNLGRVISYTVIGTILGFAGFLFAGDSDAGVPVMIQGILKLVAGIFMVIMGINMLGLFPGLRKLQPRIPNMLVQRVGEGQSNNKSPLIVGLLNGLMPCGPLQSMQIVALASGNPLVGGLSMLLFSLGTVPLMLGLGSLVSALGKKFTQKVMSIGAILIVVLGLGMLSQGGSLSGLLTPDLLLSIILVLCVIGIASSIQYRKRSYRAIAVIIILSIAATGMITWNQWSADGTAPNDDSIKIAGGRQIINTTLSSSSYPNITVQADMPVKWIIDAPEGSINGCNNRMNIKEYGISNYSFKTGENVIEFKPDKTGTFQYSCWMGMIQGTITVKEAGADASAPNDEDAMSFDQIVDSEPTPAGVRIPTNRIATAEGSSDETGNAIQKVTVQLTDKGFNPAVIVVQSGLDVEWNIINKSSDRKKRTSLLVPAHQAQISLKPGKTSLYLHPTDSFDFSTDDNAFYGFVKVVDDIQKMDTTSVKEEVSKYKTLIWPSGTFQAMGGGSSCH